MNDQAARLRELVSRGKTVKEAKTIAILSGKGGVGKSNIALNFAIGLSQQQKKVLLFDLDFGMGNIDILMGVSPKKTIIDLFRDPSLSLSNIIEEGPEGLSYIAGGSGLSGVFEMEQAYFDRFLSQLSEITYNYDYIIFDMGAGITHEHMNFALAAHECFIVTTTEMTAITDAYSVMKNVTAKQPNLPLYLIVNRTFQDKEGISTQNRLQQVASQFLKKDIHLLGMIPDDYAVVEAVKKQSPFTISNPRSLVSRKMRKLISDYLHGAQTIENHSFVTKLKMMFRGR
ncbi:MinD/ParA family protein [Salirhabdus salicampi]|uniref:MinD/ParA family protein n=1 Tax=Salirhabdus salicampi TaxID=476102 RepID=UPI0020C21B04|nr:MinD/ParA family protein [Salirhabdus salicampi]MCP8616503.1 MinD/ParA family protein [Salirhabdus salicampi]